VFLNYCFAFLKHGSLWTYRIATYAILLLGLVFVATVLVLRYLVLPYIDDYRGTIAQAITRAVGQRVTIGSITGSWDGYRPEMSLMDVKVFGAGGEPALALDRVTTALSWLSLLSAEWRFDSLAVYGPALDVKRDASGVLWIAGIAIRPRDNDSGFADWLLAQRQDHVRDATITWLDEMRGAPPLQFDKVNFRLDRDGAIHRFGLTAVPPAQVALPLVVRGEVHGRDVRELQSWTTKLYVEIDSANLALAQEWIPAPLDLSGGFGSLRLWLELNGTHVGAATADLKLTDIYAKLAPDLPELALSEVQGRLDWAQHGDSTKISATSFGFTIANGQRTGAVAIQLHLFRSSAWRAPFRIDSDRAAAWLPWPNSRSSCRSTPRCGLAWIALRLAALWRRPRFHGTANGPKGSLLRQRRDSRICRCCRMARFPDFTASAAKSTQMNAAERSCSR
jgi:uncharacterized protein YhdP